MDVIELLLIPFFQFQLSPLSVLRYTPLREPAKMVVPWDVKHVISSPVGPLMCVQSACADKVKASAIMKKTKEYLRGVIGVSL